MYRVSATPIYAVDNVVRRANSLQQTPYERLPGVAMCEQQARELGVLDEDEVRIVQDGRAKVLKLELDPALPMNCVWVQKSAQQVDELGDAIAPVEIQRLDHD